MVFFIEIIGANILIFVILLHLFVISNI